MQRVIITAKRNRLYREIIGITTKRGRLLFGDNGIAENVGKIKKHFAVMQSVFLFVYFVLLFVIRLYIISGRKFLYF